MRVRSVLLVLSLGAGAGCQHRASPSRVESCLPRSTGSEAPFVNVYAFELLHLKTLCASGVPIQSWRLTVTDGGYAGGTAVYEYRSRDQSRQEIAWRRYSVDSVLFVADSGVFEVTSGRVREVARALRAGDFGPQLDSGYMCTHCGFISAEFRTDSTVEWYRGDILDLTKSGLRDALSEFRTHAWPKVPDVSNP